MPETGLDRLKRRVAELEAATIIDEYTPCARFHRVELHVSDRPPRLYCTDCGATFLRDESKRQGYRRIR